jgi:hypothetical protein
MLPDSTQLFAFFDPRDLVGLKQLPIVGPINSV